MGRIPATTASRLRLLPELVYLALPIAKALAIEATQRSKFETGGMLLGYRTVDALVVCDAIGPGPNATHRRLSFNPDGAWQRRELFRIFQETEGSITYLGDWHSHPNGPPIPSERDTATARKIATSAKAATPQPLTVIAGCEEDVTLAAFVYHARLLRPVPLRGFRPDFDYTPRLVGLRCADLGDPLIHSIEKRPRRTPAADADPGRARSRA